MLKEINVFFPGGKRIDAKVGDFVVHTDQTLANGGGQTAPEPFQIFLASIATCAGIYALEFCHAREISSEGMALTMGYEWDEKKQGIEKLYIDLKVPSGFPDRYRKAVARVMDLCSVKKHIVHPPEFIITTS
ncbi:MAG: OsmC family protein [Desulfobacterota bacterium]|nr:OsmC family protein [Thermodesulfobacteriota bacterium]